MLKELAYTVTFPSNGKSFRGSFTFQPGLTAVSGPNWAGKSLGTIEMSRYGLFGKKALRGPATDYKSLEMHLVFTVGGDEYRVERGKKAERLLNAAGEVLAVNAEAVNQRIIQILGFGLDVFDIACACNQKESERLSKLGPAGRKRLIDEVVGLASNETVEKACREEAKGLRREAEALSANLPTVVEPVQLAGYRASAGIGVELEFVREQLKKKAALQRIIDSAGPAPVAPTETVGDIAAIEVHEAERRVADALRDQLAKMIAAIPDAKFTVEQLDLSEGYNMYRTELQRRGPQPSRSLADVNAEIEAWAHYGAVKNMLRVEAVCPKCDHSFLTNGEVPTPPVTPLAELRNEQAAHDRWSLPLPPEAVATAILSAVEISAARLGLARADEKAKLVIELAEVPVLEDRASELRDNHLLQAQWDAYGKALDAWSERQTLSTQAEMDLAALGPVVDNTAELDAAFVAARIYEGELATYHTLLEQREATLALITDKSEMALAFKAGGDALVDARSTLKAHLAPSLTRVASALLFQMTNGDYKSVVVDENMEISVDGQDIATLSGAGSTIANLALRLALGQVLVSRVFPVFLGDEIDADCSAQNSALIAEGLSNLKDQLQQIILISHKPVESADQVIDLVA